MKPYIHGVTVFVAIHLCGLYIFWMGNMARGPEALGVALTSCAVGLVLAFIVYDLTPPDGK